MIDSFKVKADVKKNNLLIQLRGYFMKSELELTYYLARKESKKLNPGFEVILDLDGMHTSVDAQNSIHSQINRIFATLGAGRVKSIGALTRMPKVKLHDIEYFAFESVGFYPN